MIRWSPSCSRRRRVFLISVRGRKSRPRWLLPAGTWNIQNRGGREKGEAGVGAADGYVKYTESEVRRLEAAVAFYRTELVRAQALARSQTISPPAPAKGPLRLVRDRAAL